MQVIIGCGNLNRRDDGIGVVIAQRLQGYFAEHPHPDVRVFDAGTGGMEVMFQAKGATSLIIVDACVSGSEPGAIFKLGGNEVTNRHNPSYSLHDFRWDHALYAGQTIFKEDFPKDITVYLVEAADTSFGLDLTPKVSQSVETVCQHIRTHVLEGIASTEDIPQSRSFETSPVVQIKNGNIYLDAALSEKYFSGLEHIILIKRDDQILILPVHHEGGGGLLLKRRNAKGDRVIHAQGFFRDTGFNETLECQIPVSWDELMAALVLDIVDKNESYKRPFV